MEVRKQRGTEEGALSLPHSSLYPASRAERERWVLSVRQGRNPLDPHEAYQALVEPEPGPHGGEVPVATLFLTNRECPFRCLMCDLWRNTLPEKTPLGAVPEQIRRALARLPAARQVKLYNSGSFFDPGAIPPEDYAEIARLCAGFEKVIVECHPAFLGERCLQFQGLIAPSRLEVAMGLETAHPAVLERLNKRMTLERFRTAAAWLREHDIDLRVFILVRPPWLSEAEGIEWAKRSLDFAAECEAQVSCVIPTRSGNGAMEALEAAGEWSPPSLAALEEALDYGLSLRRGRVFADLWDIERFAACPECASARVERLSRMNRTQRVEPAVQCAACGEAG